MKTQNEDKNTLVQANYIVMALMQSELIKLSMRLALENELAEWKGKLDPEDLKPDDFDLLNPLEEPIVKCMVQTRDLIAAIMGDWIRLTGVDDDEAFANDAAVELAQELFYGYLLPLDQTTHELILYDVDFLYISLCYIPRVAAYLAMTGELDLEGDCYDDFWNMETHTRTFDLLDRGDELVDLLCCLAEKMDQQFAEFNKAWKLQKNNIGL
jgi:hypothetical protein